jgi:hypothetical protein
MTHRPGLGSWRHRLAWLRSVLSRWRPARRLPSAGVSGPLPAGDYLGWTWGRDVAALALQDAAQPIRRIAWLRRPGANVFWLRLDQTWAAPQLHRLGARGDGGHGGLRLYRLPFPWLFMPWMRAPFPSRRGAERRSGLGQCRPLWPAPPQPGDDWQSWADSLYGLTLLRLEDIVPQPAGDAVLGADHRNSLTDDRVGAHLHLHYLDTWPELDAALHRLPRGSRLHITVSEQARPTSGSLDDFLQALAREWPHAHIRRVANRGRDIGPFLELLSEGAFDGLDCVCKLHGKVSLRAGKPTYLGQAWRRQAIHELLPEAEAMAVLIQRFRDNPRLGVLGPERLRLPSERRSIADCLERDGGLLAGLLRDRFGKDRRRDITFFAGSMFWFRPEALAALRTPPPSGWAFPPEPIADSGTLAHALERLLPSAAKFAGWRVDTLPPSGQDSNRP